jgi:membrane-associated protease RseP (regulator of RpoE activity)
MFPLSAWITDGFAAQWLAQAASSAQCRTTQRRGWLCTIAGAATRGPDRRARDQVEPGGAAARPGIRAGHVLLEVNRAAVTGAADAVDALRNVREETAFALIWRGVRSSSLS